ncbi:MAG: DUF3107 domain-containing protein [Bifidobacteriaceae bacterium]|jgi:predicted PilT family ATPase|nr:DUF3107 domain-containing protein [Bifidobacteriaceae bacterium]
MEVTIGVRQAQKEITLNVEQKAEEVRETVAHAIVAGEPLIALTDKHGRTVLIPTDALAYVEIGANEGRRVGFSA